MAILVWVRTTRHIDTLAAEIDELRLTILPYSNQGYDWLEPFASGDQVLFVLRTNQHIYGLKSFLASAMNEASFIVDWSLTEIGEGLGPYDAHIGVRADGSTYFDDRFYDPEDAYDADDATRTAECLGYSRLHSALPYDVHGATGLWVSLARERGERDYLQTQIERALPSPTARLWQGRSSILFAYRASHDLKRPSAFGLTEQVAELLDRDEIEWFLAFQIGNASVGGAIESMNPMADWIWNQGRRSRRIHSGRWHSRSEKPPNVGKKPVVVEKRKSRAATSRKA